MISLLRDFTKSWIFQLVLVLLIASFAVYGLRDVFSPVGTNNVITAGKRTVSSDQFKKMFDNYKQGYVEQGGQSFTPEQFVNEGLHIRMLSELADKTAFSAWLDQMGVKPSPKLIVDQIGKDPVFFSNVTGRFDKDTYKGLLAQQGLSEQTFEQEVSDQIAQAQYSDAALAGLRSPRIYGNLEAAFSMQARDASFFVLSPENVANPKQPTDDDLKTFYKDNQAKLTIPELRQASLITFQANDFAKAIPADEDMLKKMYQFRLNQLGDPETRTFVEVTAPDQASAQAISAALKSGQTPEAAARAHKGQVIAYPGKAKSAVPDGKIGDAAFAMKTGDISGAISGDLGYAVIKMGDIKAGTIPSYESARPQLLVAYQNEKALDKVNQVVNDFQKAHDAGEDFDAAAKRMGLKVIPLPPMTSEGKTANPQADYSKFTTLVKDVYNLPKGGTSDVEEMGSGQYFALKVNSIKPAGAPPFDEIKARLVRAWAQDKMATAIQAASDDITQRLDKGETFAQIAADLKIKPVTISDLDEQSGPQKIGGQLFPPPIPAQSSAQVGNQVFGRLVTTKVNGTLQLPVDNFQVVIAHLDAVHQADAKSANLMASTARLQMSQAISRDIGEVTRTGARQVIKTATFPVIAERALGVTPVDTKDSDTKTKDNGAKAKS